MLLRARPRLLILTAALVASPALAAPVEVSVTPVLGDDTPGGVSWHSYAARVRGVGSGVQRGTVELSDGEGGTARVPFAVSGGEEITVELFGHAALSGGTEILVRDGAGRVTSRAAAPPLRGPGPLLFDVSAASRLPMALRDAVLAVAPGPGGFVPDEGVDLVVSDARFDARSGEPVVPRRAAGYAAATVVLMRTEILAALGEPERRALSDWITTGGVLALVASRPEDLGHPAVSSLVGQGVRSSPDPSAARHSEFETVDSVVAAAAPGTGAGYVTRSIEPGESVASHLVGFQGGNLVTTRWGAAADHGSGRVHLLAFDPNAPAFVDDAWVRASVTDLVRASLSERVRAFGPASPFDANRAEPVRRLLDPNEASQWSVGVSAVVLLLYSLLAIPLVFRRASRKNDPLRAIRELPVWALGALLLIVGLGAVARGGRARARRLSIVECAAGEGRGTAVRFRAFFTSRARALEVSSTEPLSLLDVLAQGRDVPRTLVVDQRGARLEDLQGRPWETVLVREDGFTDLGGTVTFRREGADTEITNGLRKDLVAVVAKDAGGDLRFFPRIAAGRTARVSAGDPLGAAAASPPAVSLPRRMRPVMASHRFEAYRLQARADAAASGAGAAYVAIEALAADDADFWPDDAPSLVATVEGGDGMASDAGLAVDTNWMILRVVGRRPAP